MKSNYKSFNPQELDRVAQRAAREEVEKYRDEVYDKIAKDIQYQTMALVFWELHLQFGFGAERLRRLKDGMEQNSALLSSVGESPREVQQMLREKFDIDFDKSIFKKGRGVILVAKYSQAPNCEGCAMATQLGKNDFTCAALENTHFGGKPCPFRKTPEEYLEGQISGMERAMRMCKPETLERYYGSMAEMGKQLDDRKKALRRLKIRKNVIANVSEVEVEETEC